MKSRFKIKVNEKKLLICSMVLFAISLLLPAFEVVPSSEEAILGIELLVSGWLGILLQIWGAIPWLANPLLFASWAYFFKNKGTSCMFSFAALALGLSFLFVDEVIMGSAGSDTVESLQFGYFLWIASMLTMVVASHHLFLKQGK